MWNGFGSSLSLSLFQCPLVPLSDIVCSHFISFSPSKGIRVVFGCDFLGESLPTVLPLMCFALDSMRIGFAGMDRHCRRLGESMVLWCGATVVADWEGATLVVVHRASPPLLESLRKLGLPLVRIEWVLRCFKEQTLVPIEQFPVQDELVTSPLSPTPPSISTLPPSSSLSASLPTISTTSPDCDPLHSTKNAQIAKRSGAGTHPSIRTQSSPSTCSSSSTNPKRRRVFKKITITAAKRTTSSSSSRSPSPSSCTTDSSSKPSPPSISTSSSSSSSSHPLLSSASTPYIRTTYSRMVRRQYEGCPPLPHGIAIISLLQDATWDKLLRKCGAVVQPLDGGLLDADKCGMALAEQRPVFGGFHFVLVSTWIWNHLHLSARMLLNRDSTIVTKSFFKLFIATGEEPPADAFHPKSL